VDYEIKVGKNLLQGEIPAMKKRNVLISCLLVLVLMASFAAIAAAAGKETTGDFVDDSVITTKIKSILAKDELLKSFEISVETRKGVVQLSGWVGTQEAVNKAGQIARDVKGVKSVKNNLIVK
jgi:osmotically-inducible protein OsmY